MNDNDPIDSTGLVETPAADGTTPGTEVAVPGDNAISVIEDEQGLLLLGDDKAIDAWLAEAAVPKRDTRKIRKNVFKGVAKAARLLGDAQANGGRWVKMTKESADLVRKYGFKGEGVARQGNGRIVAHLKFENLGKVKSLAGPQAMFGVEAIMAQMALEQAVAEITDYLKTIDKKIDDLLQDQKDQTVADLVGVARMIDETMAIRENVGLITQTTWSKIAGSPQIVARAQSYALIKIENITKKLAEASDAPEAESIARQLAKDVVDWLSILANAVQLQDKLSILEIDRVVAEEPETLERYRKGVITARTRRLCDIEAKLRELVASIRESSRKVRDQKLLHPISVDNTLQTLDAVNAKLSGFASALGLQAAGADISMAEQWHVVAGRAIVDGANQIGSGLESGAKLIGDGAAAGAKAAAAGMAHVGDQAGKMLGDGAKQLGQLGDGLGSGVKQAGAGVKDGAKQAAKGVADGLNDAGKRLRGLFGR